MIRFRGEYTRGSLGHKCYRKRGRNRVARWTLTGHKCRCVPVCKSAHTCVYTCMLKVFVSSKESATFYSPTSCPWPPFHIPGFWKPELWIFLFWTRSLFFNSETASPLYLHFSKNGNLKWYYKSFAKARTFKQHCRLLRREKIRRLTGAWWDVGPHPKLVKAWLYSCQWALPELVTAEN